MLTRRNVLTLWLLLLLHISGSAFKLNLFDANPVPQEGDMRLFGPHSPSEGRVEVYHDGKWGTVCDDGWDMAEAQVVCRQLHYPGAESVVTGKNFGEVSGPVWLDDIQCNGSETHLLHCGFKNWGVTDCTHKEDVGVICETSLNGTIGDFSRLLDHSFGLSNDLGQLFDSGSSCDFLISAQSATGNRQEDGTPEIVAKTFCAHKMILSRFPLFNALEGNSSINVTISESCQPYFRSFIRYLYTRKIDVTFSSVQCLHWMASKFGVKQLMEDMGRLFSKVLPEDDSFHTQVSFYKYAKETGDLVLQENCLQFMAWNYQNLVISPAWADLPVELVEALLVRSDLVVSNEHFLLMTLESWITKKGNSISLETQADLLSRIRFPMIPVERLYELESNSSLRSAHKEMYQEKMLKAFQFNVLLFSDLSSKPNFNREDDDYQPRIYSSRPWGHLIGTWSLPARHRYSSSSRFPFGQTTTRSFSTPVHNSLIFKEIKIQWEANVFRSQYECSSQGVRCPSVPMARLIPQSHNIQQGTVRFQNLLLLLCKGKYICHVQDFKKNMAYITQNGTQLAYPCPDTEYSYRFIVRPQYF